MISLLLATALSFNVYCSKQSFNCVIENTGDIAIRCTVESKEMKRARYFLVRAGEIEKIGKFREKPTVHCVER